MNKYSELETLKARARDEIKRYENSQNEAKKAIEDLEKNIEKWEGEQLSIFQGILFKN